MKNQTAYIISLGDSRTDRHEEFVVLSKEKAYNFFDNYKAMFKTRYKFISEDNFNELDRHFLTAYADEEHKHDIAYANIQARQIKSEVFPQTDNTYNDEGLTYIDAWPSTDENDENGRSLATIDTDGQVEYLTDNETGKDKGGKSCLNVLTKIEETITQNVYGEWTW